MSLLSQVSVKTVHYSTVKLVLMLIACVGMTWASFAMLQSERGKVQFAGAVFAVIGPAGFFAMLKALWGDRVALRYDARSIEITTLWRSRRFAWDEVESVGFTQVSSYAAYGLIKTGTSESLTIKVRGGMIGTRSFNLSKLLLDLTTAEYRALAEHLDLARMGTYVPSSASAAPVRDRLGQQDDAGFDADAALARYLARRPQPEPGAPLLNGQPLAAPASAHRPSGFGRKGL